jgi:competence protein ComEA
MFKKILLIAATVFLFAGAAFAATDLNTADKAALDGIKSIGTKTADAIIAERTKGGKFKDWDDFIRRVKGVGPKNAEKMSAGGLTVNGAALANAPAAAPKAMEKAKEKK